jgi:hypothetical protein
MFAMNRRLSSLSLLSLSAFVFLTACETTGDPTQGGLFGWSESKAKTRQVALHSALELEEDRGSAARSQTSRLQATKSRNAAVIREQRASLNRMLSQLDEVDRAGGSGRTGALRSRIAQTRSDSSLDDSELRSRVSSLDSEVSSLRKEYGLLLQRR